MDVYKYIPSKDIREYLQKIKYQFTQMQAAYIIWMIKIVRFSKSKKHSNGKQSFKKGSTSFIRNAWCYTNRFCDGWYRLFGCW